MRKKTWENPERIIPVLLLAEVLSASGSDWIIIRKKVRNSLLSTYAKTDPMTSIYLVLIIWMHLFLHWVYLGLRLLIKVLTSHWNVWSRWSEDPTNDISINSSRSAMDSKWKPGYKLYCLSGFPWWLFLEESTLWRTRCWFSIWSS